MTSDRRILLLVLISCVLACHREPAPAAVAQTAASEQPSPADPAEARIAADVAQLASDAFEGRETGTRGYDLAAEYVAQRFKALGLEPAGEDGGFFQTVPLLKAVRQEAGAVLVVERNGRRIELRFRDQFLPTLNYNAPVHALKAEAVFVGQGVHAPELGHDDFAGLDVTGRIVVLFSGAPTRFDHDQRAFYSSSREKLRSLSERGAIGAVFVNRPEDEAETPWARSAENWQRAGMRLRGADGKAIDSFPQLRAMATVSAAAADLIFADAPQSAAALFQATNAGTLKGFALPGTLSLAGRTRVELLSSRNVVARLPGDDPSLAAEHVVYTAHLDHLGIGAPVPDSEDADAAKDAIYNGALDNALGVSIMLESARMLQQAKPAPRRSMLFVAVTAEEKGLLGAEWFARQPTVAADGLVANINLDMPVLLAPSTDVVPIGVEHSSLKAPLETAASELGVTLSPDPFPEDVVFVRSDQYPFIRAGVPAVYLIGGMISADDKRHPKLAMRKFMREHYHQPSDEASLPIAYGDAVRLARLNARIGQLVGDAAQRPAWNPGDFFGDRFAKPK
ncbi:MAG: M28 family peptidase [Lysobacteraceae bacterium]|nr:MAG: M28 family peptidase [Xanthomonadaceae bacterium]